jgi:hypothetical protein
MPWDALSGAHLVLGGLGPKKLFGAVVETRISSTRQPPITCDEQPRITTVAQAANPITDVPSEVRP